MAKWFKKKSKKTVEAKETAVAGLSKDTVESARAEESVQAESVVEESVDLATATKESTLPPGKEAPSAEETTVLIQVASIQNEIEPTSSADRSVQKVTTCDASIVDIDDDDEKEDCKTQVTFNDENTYVDDESTIEESENIDPLEYKRVDTMHAQLKIPLSAKSGDYLVINHGGARSIKVPTGQQGQSITVKMVQNEKEEEVPSTGFLCCM